MLVASIGEIDGSKKVAKPTVFHPWIQEDQRMFEVCVPFAPSVMSVLSFEGSFLIVEP
jgi:hypothetical protein